MSLVYQFRQNVLKFLLKKCASLHQFTKFQCFVDSRPVSLWLWELRALIHSFTNFFQMNQSPFNQILERNDYFRPWGGIFSKRFHPYEYVPACGAGKTIADLALQRSSFRSNYSDISIFIHSCSGYYGIECKNDICILLGKPGSAPDWASAERKWLKLHGYEWKKEIAHDVAHYAKYPKRHLWSEFARVCQNNTSIHQF